MDFLGRYSKLLDQGYTEETAAVLADEESFDYYEGDYYSEWD